MPIATTPGGDTALDTLLVVGGAIGSMRSRDEAAAMKRIADHPTRSVSMCTGAFPLAEAGLLNGRRATTHWSRARDLQQGYPAVTVDADRIFVADGPF